MKSLNYSTDDVFKTTALGSQNKALGYSLYGYNHKRNKGSVPINKYIQGFTFFTRPQLNMTHDNIRNARQLFGLLTEDATSLGRFIRTTLDPRLMAGKNGMHSTLTNNRHAFIPILTNSLLTLSGWPDVVFNSFVGKEGLKKEVYTQIDSSARITSIVDISATFKNSNGEPILKLLNTWGLYSTLVFEGILQPYPDFWVENELDYNTRIFRIVLNKTGQKVAKIAATGPGFVEAVEMGAGFDFNRDTPYHENSGEQNFRFKFVGVEYDDAILIYEFNNIVAIFNPDMEDGVRESLMEMVTPEVANIFNYQAYPRINPDNNDMEFWVEKALASRIESKFKTSGLYTHDATVT